MLGRKDECVTATTSMTRVAADSRLKVWKRDGRDTWEKGEKGK